MKYLRRKRKKLPVTLIVGIVCRDAVVLAADSQTSYGTLKLAGTNKISRVDFKGGKSVLVAESGMVTLSRQAIDIFSTKAKQTAATSKEGISRLLKESLFEVRLGQIGLYPKRKYTLEEWKEYFRDKNPVELTTAYFWEDEPCLFTISIDECQVVWAKEYSVSGVGDYLGHYLLKEYFIPRMDRDLGAAIAIKIAKDAATYVEGCNTPIKAALIERSLAPWQFPPLPYIPPYQPTILPLKEIRVDAVHVFTSNTVKEIERIIEKTELRTRRDYIKKILADLESQSRKALKSLYED
jgi:hypothetical protein